MPDDFIEEHHAYVRFFAILKFSPTCKISCRHAEILRSAAAAANESILITDERCGRAGHIRKFLRSLPVYNVN